MQRNLSIAERDPQMAVIDFAPLTTLRTEDPLPPDPYLQYLAEHAISEQCMLDVRDYIAAGCADKHGKRGQPGMRSAMLVTFMAYCSALRAAALGRLCWCNMVEAADGGCTIDTIDKGKRRVTPSLTAAQWALVKPYLAPCTCGHGRLKCLCSIWGGVLTKDAVSGKVRRVTKHFDLRPDPDTGKMRSVVNGAHAARHGHGRDAKSRAFELGIDGCEPIMHQLGHTTRRMHDHYTALANKQGSSRLLRV